MIDQNAMRTRPVIVRGAPGVIHTSL